MRQYRRLDVVTVGPEGALSASADDAFGAGVLVRREADHAALSFYSGAIELTLRFKITDLLRTLTHLHPSDQWSAGRDVGTGASTLHLHLRPDGSLVLRPTLTLDAAGALTLNYEMNDAARQALTDWLNSAA